MSQERSDYRPMWAALGLDLEDGVVRVSFVHYNTPAEIERLEGEGDNDCLVEMSDEDFVGRVENIASADDAHV